VNNKTVVTSYFLLIMVFWVLMPCDFVGATNPSDEHISSTMTLKMEVIRSSKTLATTYKIM
jgi:hypothetical protein